jgi:transposase
VEVMRPWPEMQLGRIPSHGGLADSVRYTLSRWPALYHFLDDGRIELDNPVERANDLSPAPTMALSDGPPPRLCKAQPRRPFTYLRDMLQRMTEAHPIGDELLPWD